MSEIRLDLVVKGKKKVFTQDFVPYKKALDYTEQEAEFFQDENGEAKKEVNQIELMQFRADFVASLFNDDELTGEVLLNGLDAKDKDKLMDIIYYRVLGYEKPSGEVDPKVKKEL
ncbi:phage tail assembly chaperone G [Enterococcus sp. AZ102]|uniref:phage tail assembly chaperone G n=1 Tax=Enterococcus sp. AZ102 TaxID=2774865 RepID=UPI003F273976